MQINVNPILGQGKYTAELFYYFHYTAAAKAALKGAKYTIAAYVAN